MVTVMDSPVLGMKFWYYLVRTSEKSSVVTYGSLGRGSGWRVDVLKLNEDKAGVYIAQSLSGTIGIY